MIDDRILTNSVPIRHLKQTRAGDKQAQTCLTT